MNAERASATLAVIGPGVPAVIAQVASELEIVPDRFANAAAAEAKLPPDGVAVLVVAHDVFNDAPLAIEALRARKPFVQVPILVLDTDGANLSRQAALAAGATDVLIAPIDRHDLRTRLENLIELAGARRALAPRSPAAERRSDGDQREREIIRRLLLAAESRDNETGDHVVRVAAFAIATAEALGLSEAEANDIGLASTMHDIGKIGVPDSILRKASPLTEGEREAMREHAERGFRLLDGSSSRLLRLASEIALTHHEHWDGSGYPQGLAGESIPLPGRIVAVADVFDALTSARVYKPGWSLERARHHLEEHAGSHFDPDCVAAFLSRWDDVRAVVEEQPHASDAA